LTVAEIMPVAERDVHGLVTLVTADVVRELLAPGLLTTQGLMHVHALVRQPGRLAEGDVADLLRAEVAAALAEHLRCDPGDLPESDPLP
jgi:hypothetical protein